ncbi:MAG: DUF2946 family protein [Gammaproteobacteria bacterium]
MSTLHPRLRRWVWVAVWVIGLRALVPALAMLPVAMASDVGQPMPWMTLCSSQGVVSDGPESGGSSSSQGQPCPGCLLHAGGLALPPPPPLQWWLPERFDPLPQAFAYLTARSYAWAVPWSRGPPFEMS